MKIFKIYNTAVLGLLFFHIGIFAQEGFTHFKKGQTVCFIGNSITQAGTYHMLLQAFHATRFPENEVKFISCGVSGDVAPGMIARFNKDVLVHNPDYAFLMTGMNDMYSDLFSPGLKVDASVIEKRKEALKNYKANTTKIVELLVSNHIKPILMTPSIYDETAAIKTPSLVGKNDALEQCAILVRELGKKYNVPVVDLNPFMLAINLEAQKKNPSFTIVGQDRVHHVETGHFIMAYKILNTLFSPSTVSSVGINAKNKTIFKHENSSIKIEKSNTSLEFEVLATTLPFPIKKEFTEAQSFVPFEENYNKELLKIKNLKKGKYVLEIDNKVIDTLSNKELDFGINLATNHLTPQYQQADKVFDLCVKYSEIQSKIRIIALVEYRNLNTYKGPATIEGKKEFLAKAVENSIGKSWHEYTKMVCEKYFEYQPIEKQLWRELDQVRSEIYKANIPVNHKYSVRKLH